MSNKKKVMTSGNLAFAEAMRQINPDVVAAYPITPSTEIPMRFADFVANGKVDSEYVAVESEHSAISACVGASISGARVMTASSANGVALMHEIFPIAASFRAPIVFGLVNRCLGAPVNIHCDHSDSMPERDSGWVQIYCEDAQEVYDSVLLAVRLAEDPRVLTPVFVCQDGFITSHCYEPVELLDDETVRGFVGERKAAYPLLDVDNPVSYGSFTMAEYYFEIKRNQMEGMNNVLPVYEELAAVLDRSASIGGTAPLAAEIKSVLYDLEERVPVQEYIFGLGGRDFFAADARAVFERMMKNDYRAGARFIGLLERGGEDVRD